MIPEFDGTSRSRVREFLIISNYTMENINFSTNNLLKAIVCSKLKGKAMIWFSHLRRDVRSSELNYKPNSSEYLSKWNTTYVQIEFNSLKLTEKWRRPTKFRTPSRCASHRIIQINGKRETLQQQTILKMIKLQALYWNRIFKLN